MRLRSGVYQAVDRGGRVYLLHRSTSQSVGQLTGPLRAVLHQLAEGECAVAALRAEAEARAGDSGVADLNDLLDQLRAGGWLHITVLDGSRAAYTMQPHGRPPGPPGAGARPSGDDVLGDAAGDGALVLSRFAVLRRSGSDLVLESPRSWCTIQVHDPRVATALVGLIAASDPAALGSLPAALAARLNADLASTGLLVRADEEESELRLRQWSPHELWFHSRSRGEGVPEDHFGRTRWAAGEFDPLPGRRPSYPGATIDLPPIDLSDASRPDATLTAALERRRSIRRHDDENPVSLAQIAEFLYRSAGFRRVLRNDGVDYLSGPNPSGGALDPLEYYLAVRLVADLEPGLYRYDRVEHRLEPVSGNTRLVRRLVAAAQGATTGPSGSQTYPPQLVVLLAARFGRVGWSYETLAYSLILKQVGVAYQTMYCVATAMGLAPCALGAGDPGAFAEATGQDPLVEGTVGEFILGSRRPEPDDPVALVAT